MSDFPASPPPKDEPLTVSDLGGEAREGFGSSQLEGRLKRYGNAKADALSFRRFLLDHGEQAIADAIGDCGNYAVFREYFTIGQTRLSRFCTCKKHLICPLCAIRRGAKALRVYLARVQALMASDPALRPFLVTVTVKNGPDLGERFRHLTSCLRAYHKRRKGKGQKGEVLKAHSAVWSYEFTNKGHGWHPHVHAIWLCHDSPDPFKLSQEWHALTGDSFIVDSRPVDMSDPVAGFCEVFKYALKFSDLENHDRLTAYRTLRGKRLQDSFGALRGLDVEPTDQDELLDDLPYIEHLYQFVSGRGYVLAHSARVDKRTPEEALLLSLLDLGWSDSKISEFMDDYLKRPALSS